MLARSRRRSSSRPAKSSSPGSEAADGLANVTVVRLRSGTLYEARVVTASAVLASGAFTSASTGVAEFDDGPVCNVTGQKCSPYNRTGEWDSVFLGFSRDVSSCLVLGSAAGRGRGKLGRRKRGRGNPPAANPAGHLRDHSGGLLCAYADGQPPCHTGRYSRGRGLSSGNAAGGSQRRGKRLEPSCERQPRSG